MNWEQGEKENTVAYTPQVSNGAKCATLVTFLNFLVQIVSYFLDSRLFGQVLSFIY